MVSGSGSSWFQQSLSSKCSGVCFFGFEPLCCNSNLSPANKLHFFEKVFSFPEENNSKKINDTEQWFDWAKESSELLLPLSKKRPRRILHSLQKSSFSTHRTAIGFKSRIQFVDVEERKSFARLLRLKNVRLIVMYRKSNLKRWLAEFRRIQHQVGHFSIAKTSNESLIVEHGSSDLKCHDGQPHSYSANADIRFDIPLTEKTLRELAESAWQTTRLLKQSRLLRRPTLYITYEELTSNHAQVLRDACQFLNSSLTETSFVERKNNFLKSTCDDLCFTIRNYDEFCDFLNTNERAKLKAELEQGSLGECQCK